MTGRTRRAVLGATAATAALAATAGAIPALAAADPLLDLERAERAAYAAFATAAITLDRAERDFLDKRGRWRGSHEDADLSGRLIEERDAAEEAWEAVVDQIVKTRAVNLAGLAAKLRLIAWDMGEGGGAEWSEELVAGAVADAERLAGMK